MGVIGRKAVLLILVVASEACFCAWRQRLPCNYSCSLVCRLHTGGLKSTTTFFEQRNVHIDREVPGSMWAEHKGARNSKWLSCFAPPSGGPSLLLLIGLSRKCNEAELYPEHCWSFQ